MQKHALMHRRTFVTMATMATLAAGLRPLPTLADEPESFFASAVTAPLTLDELVERNEGNPDFAYVVNGEGCLTWVRGSFYDGTVIDVGGVMDVLSALSDLLGITPETEFVKGLCLVDDNGYRYYTMKQVHAGVTVAYAAVKVIVDPQARVVAVSSSLVQGVEGDAEARIDADGALEAAHAYVEANDPENAYTFYEGRVDRVFVNHPDTLQTTMAYVVYSDNPAYDVPTTDLTYLAHYIGADGSYFYRLPVASIGDEVALEGSSAQSFFEGKEQRVFSGEVALFNGGTRAVEVPVLFDPETGMYCLADAQRKVAAIQMGDFAYKDATVTPVSSPDNQSWDERALLAYNTYLQVYDFYAALGWKGCDGLQTPIAILANQCTADGTLSDGACYMGKMYGWQCFATSALNPYGECVDVCAHEYGHAVTCTSMTAILYQGEYGAINESFADILGNICEMLLGATDDTEWLVAENSGEAIRSMSDPTVYGQPEWVGDIYYAPVNVSPSPLNDNGGVHINNSLLCRVAVSLDRAGISLEEQARLWITVAFALTPVQGFKDIVPILMYAADVSGLGAQKDVIEAALEEAGVTGDLSKTAWRLREDCGLVRYSTLPSERYMVLSTNLIPADTFTPRVNWATSPDDEGVVEMQFAAGDYVIVVMVADAELQTVVKGVYTDEGWLVGDITYDQGTVVTVPDGGTIDLGQVSWR